MFVTEHKQMLCKKNYASAVNSGIVQLVKKMFTKYIKYYRFANKSCLTSSNLNLNYVRTFTV